MMYQPKNWMLTYTGQRVDPLDVRSFLINIEDIAHSLAMQCRYGGHSNRFYSVAEHSVLISRALESNSYSEGIAFAGLLHDAAEAYIGDIITPLKTQISYAIKFHEHSALREIFMKFGAPWPIHPIVHSYDKRIASTEMKTLFRFLIEQDPDTRPLDVDISGWNPEDAEAEFLKRFHELWPRQ